jgi:hypothetical protein
MIDKRLKRKRSLSKLPKRTLGSLQVRTQHLGAKKKGKRKIERERYNKAMRL